MKTNNLNLLTTLILTCSFLGTKASSLPAIDSLPSAPAKTNIELSSRTDSRLMPSFKKDGETKGLTGFIFSAAITPHFETTVPPVNLYFEHGIAGVASAGISFGGLYDSQSDIDYHAATISFGVRGCGYVFPIISKISGKEIKQYGFQPYAGLVFDYFTTATTIDNEDVGTITSSEFGVCIGTRWYPGKGKFGILGEFNSNGIGSNIRLGISLGR